jgi:hypothetical protein
MGELVMEETYFERQQREQREYEHWLRSLQPGQGAVITGNSDYTLFTVERLTRTQIIGKTDYNREMRFRRSDGREVGRSYGPQLVKMTPLIRDAMEERRLRRWLDEIAYHNAKVKPSLAQLQAMKKAYDRVAHEEQLKAALDNRVTIQ